MGVPSGPSAGFESDLSALHPLGIERVEKRVDTDRTREPCFGAFG
jgi:hypothetical protein